MAGGALGTCTHAHQLFTTNPPGGSTATHMQYTKHTHGAAPFCNCNQPACLDPKAVSSSCLQCFCMELHMLLHKGGDEVVGVVVTLLHAAGDGEPRGCSSCLKRLRFQLDLRQQQRAGSDDYSVLTNHHTVPLWSSRVVHQGGLSGRMVLVEGRACTHFRTTRRMLLISTMTRPPDAATHAMHSHNQ